MQYARGHCTDRQVLACDVDNVAREILIGVEAALKCKKKEYMESQAVDLKRFSAEVNLVVQ